MKKLLREAVADANIVVYRDGRVVSCVIGGKVFKAIGEFAEEVTEDAMVMENRKQPSG